MQPIIFCICISVNIYNKPTVFISPNSNEKGRDLFSMTKDFFTLQGTALAKLA